LAEPSGAAAALALDEALLSRVEDASINASAPPQQRWLDGWILRFSPGKAKRARCINAVAAGRLPLQRRLQLAAEVFREAGLPMVVRITRFSQPASLDADLAACGYARLDDTRVMVCQALPTASGRPLPPGTRWVHFDAAGYADAVGALRGSPAEQCLAHAQRLASSPVPYRGHAIVRDGDGQVLACGQYAREAELFGLYDVHTLDSARGQGLARLLCERLLSLAATEGGKTAYLQVESDNLQARRLYASLGFADGYAYHYRQAPPAAAD
jgi:ribosomal protein S18 acetylase RimI-like enzyme